MVATIGFAAPAVVPSIRHRVSVTQARPAFRARRQTVRAVVRVPTPSDVDTGAAELSPRLQKFADWFYGDFDNYHQAAADRANADMSRRDWHEHIHCRVTPIPAAREMAPAGSAVLFANYYYNGRPDVIYRQRMYKITELPSGILEMRIYKMTFLHGLLVGGTNSIFDDFDLGSLDDTSKYEYLEGAEVFWRYEEGKFGGTDMVCDGDHFVGYMREGGWVSVDDGGLTVKDNLLLTKEDLWVAEEVYTKDGTMIAGNRHGIHHKMRRVRDDDEIRWTVDQSLPFIGP